MNTITKQSDLIFNFNKTPTYITFQPGSIFRLKVVYEGAGLPTHSLEKLYRAKLPFEEVPHLSPTFTPNVEIQYTSVDTARAAGKIHNFYVPPYFKGNVFIYCFESPEHLFFNWEMDNIREVLHKAYRFTEVHFQALDTPRGLSKWEKLNGQTAFKNYIEQEKFAFSLSVGLNEPEEGYPSEYPLVLECYPHSAEAMLAYGMTVSPSPLPIYGARDQLGTGREILPLCVSFCVVYKMTLGDTTLSFIPVLVPMENGRELATEIEAVGFAGYYKHTRWDPENYKVFIMSDDDDSDSEEPGDDYSDPGGSGPDYLDSEESKTDCTNPEKSDIT